MAVRSGSNVGCNRSDAFRRDAYGHLNCIPANSLILPNGIHPHRHWSHCGPHSTVGVDPVEGADEGIRHAGGVARGCGSRLHRRIQAVRKELAEFERRENEFRKQNREERAAELRLPFEKIKIH